MATIHAPTSPLARCSTCGVQRQFHCASDVPHSADRDHVFVAETIDDFEPGDLSPEQLVEVILDADGRLTLAGRAHACRVELRTRVRSLMGVDWDDLVGAVE